MTMKPSVIWDITPCSPLKLDLRFGGACCCLLHAGFLHGLLFGTECGGECEPKTSVDFCLTPRHCSPKYETTDQKVSLLDVLCVIHRDSFIVNSVRALDLLHKMRASRARAIAYKVSPPERHLRTDWENDESNWHAFRTFVANALNKHGMYCWIASFFKFLIALTERKFVMKSWWIVSHVKIVAITLV
jgi:hypothetical protein